MKKQNITHYETLINPARQAFGEGLKPYLTNPTPEVVGIFLINFCSLGVGMTEQVPNWIRRSGENSVAKGYKTLGNALIKHAEHEAGHHVMMVEDTRSMVKWWNARFKPTLNADSFLKQPLSKGVREYQDLHERYINSDTPYAQIAIEYEIERVSLSHGPQLFGMCAKVLGPEVLKNLSFLEEHMKLDVGHTEYNAAALDRFLGEHPEAITTLVAAGTKALKAYGQFVRDCFDQASVHLSGAKKAA